MTSPKETKVYIISFIILLVDAAIIYSSYLIGIYLKFGQIFDHEVYQELKYVLIGLILIGIITLSIYDLYNDLYKSNEEIILSVLITVAITGMMTLVYIFLDDRFIYSRFVIIYALSIQVILLSIWHIIVHHIMIKTQGLIKVMVVGPLEEAKAVSIKLMTKYKKRYEIVFLLPLKQMDLASELLKEVDVMVICSGLSYDHKDSLRNIAVLQGKSIFLIPEVYEISIRHTKWQQFDDMAVLSMSHVGMGAHELFVKRAMDLSISAIGLVLFLPIYIGLALLVRLDSKGPVIYKQERLTRHNKTFTLYKFRTMVEEAEAETGPVLSIEGDQRLTKLGKFLRKSRLDESPQLLNVFLGHMSLVGPRPERPVLAEAIKKNVPHFEYRLAVKAGLTGLAQVMGGYSTLPSDKLRYDLMYMSNYSLLLDVKLMMQTIKIIFMGEKAKGVDEGKLKVHEASLEQIISHTKTYLQ